MSFAYGAPGDRRDMIALLHAAVDRGGDRGRRCCPHSRSSGPLRRSPSPGCSPRKPWLVPIPGTTKLARLEENIGAASLVLTADDLREIAAATAITPSGDRYAEELERLTGR